MNTIDNACNTFMNGIQKVYDGTGKFLDKHPSLYKVVLVACHFFRAVSMFGFMMWMPTPLPVTIGVMVAGSLLYRAAVERFCCFRFTIPSLVGAGAAWLSHLTFVNSVSNAALTSLGITVNALASIPLLGYTAWIVYLSHKDIENRMKQLKLTQQNVPTLVPDKNSSKTSSLTDCCQCH